MGQNSCTSLLSDRPPRLEAFMMKLLGLILLCLWSGAHATNYTVDATNGDDDANDGVSSPFKTIAKCITQLISAGDECRIAEGRYHEDITIDGLKGTQDKPFKITGLSNDRPIWDGTVLIQPKKWDFDKKTKICSAKIKENITALFLNEDLLTAARWPNARWSDKTTFNSSFWAHSDGKSKQGRMVDNGKAGPVKNCSLAASGINANGSMAILNIGSFMTFVREVTYHKPNSKIFRYNHDFDPKMKWKPTMNQYYLEASLALLDAPEEWFYDMETQTLYLIQPENSTTDCPDPSRDILRGRTMDYGLTIRNTKFLEVSNMTFFASNIDASSVAHDSVIDEITLRNVRMLFGASSHRMLKSDKVAKSTKMMARVRNRRGKKGKKSPKYILGKVSVINCEFIGSEGTTLAYGGRSPYIHNNLFAYNDWTAHLTDDVSGGGATAMSKSEDEEFSQNTLLWNGPAHGIHPSKNGNISYNFVRGQCWGLIQHDGAGIHFQTGAQKGANANHNWVADSPKYAIRFDGAGSRRGTNGTQAYNVAWNSSGLIIKGDSHRVYNNLAIDKYEDP